MTKRDRRDPRLLLKARSVLLATRDLLSDRSRWTQGTVARKADQTPEHPTSSRAQSWCALGALARTCHEMRLPASEEIRIHRLAEDLLREDLVRFDGVASVPQANDRIGGYEIVMDALARLLDHTRLERLTKRSEAAMKGWETRRRIRAEYDQPRAPQPQIMTFGGTLPSTPSSNAAPVDAKKEITI